MRNRLLLVILGMIVFAPTVRAVPTLLQLFNQERDLEAKNQSHHIGNQLRNELRDASNEPIQKENEEIKKIESLPTEIAAAKDLISRKRSELSSLDAQAGLDFKKEQDDYNKALFYYKKYFESKAMLDDERQDEIDYVESQIRDLRAENPELKSWLNILKAQQENESRTFTGKEDKFGLEIEQSKENLSSEESSALDAVIKADEVFSEIKTTDIEFDYNTSTSNQPEALGQLKSVLNRYQAYEKLLNARLTKKAASLQAPSDVTEVVDSLAREGYPKELKILIIKGDWQDFTYVNELLELRRDIEAINNLTNAIAALRPKVTANLKLVIQRAELTTTIAETEAKLSELQQNLHTAKLDKNHFGYLSLATAMDAVSDKIRAEVQKRGAVAVKSKTVRDYRIAFLTLMHSLESFELELTVKYAGNDPYSNHPAPRSIESVVKYFTGQATDFFTKDKRPSKKHLMRNYQLALNGLSGLGGSFTATLSKLKSAVLNKNATPLTEYIKFDNIMSVIKSIDEFSRQNPILAADLQRNLTHTYKLMMQDPKSGVLSDVFASAKMVYEIKEVENIARDWLLGSAEYLYSDNNLGDPLSVEVLTLIDIAEMAPYLAGAYVGASGGGTVAGWAETMVTWIPVIGSYKPMKVLAKAAGGVAQVHLQKLAAERISRNHELLANTLRRGFEAYFDGKSPKDIATEVVKYQAMRKLIRILGTARKLGAATALKNAGQCMLDNKGAAVAGAGVGLGGGTLIGAAAITAGGAAIVPLLIPVVAVAGCTLGAVAVSHALKDIFVPGRKEARKLKALAEQLKQVSIPTLNPNNPNAPELANNELAWAQSELPKAIDRIDFKALGVKAQGNEEELQEIVMKAIQEELEKQELAGAEARAQKANIDNAPDHELEPLKNKLQQLARRPNFSDSEVTGLIGEALKMRGYKEELDAFEISIFDKLGELQQSVKSKNTNKAKELFEQIQTEVRLLRIRQMEAGLVNTLDVLQQ